MIEREAVVSVTRRQRWCHTWKSKLQPENISQAAGTTELSMEIVPKCL